ncbi:hypothetical protein K503DRAFT_801147 [Rhizopogon vinicolor AM-OR11-026]|uniref:F-box domain-containing protein n=1 Tax=Rhizopogon vinicolor AM-OR11-026 TaxID=1314800 RepID=A0A1B7MY80_9AGAM|nr:hypothetical protein K503DRAFT_801147 [Rhizopogon vinicolor AM-OR11-026]
MSHVLRRCELLGIYSDFESIGTHCPVLESLSVGSVTMRATDELPYKLLSETVRSCKQLKHLKCTLLDCASWKHLSDLPTLVTVMIDEDDDDDSDIQSDAHNVHFAPFLNITCLDFRMNTAAYVITIMQHSEFPSLKVFRLEVKLSPAEAEHLLHALSKCGACQTIECIDINSVDANEYPVSLLQNPIKHLFCFTQLRTLLLRPSFPIYLDNDLLMEAVSSWRHIRSLSFYSTPLVTFRGLFAALRLCPHLDRFIAEIDAVNIDVDPDAESFQHTSLQTLNLGFSRVGDPEAIAGIISSMFPCISQVNSTFNRKEWVAVNRRLGYLRSRR